MRAKSGMGLLGAGIRLLVGSAAAFFLGAAPAFAGIGGAAVPEYPAVVNVGDVFSATLTVTNLSDGGNSNEDVTANGIFHTPACGAGLGTCTTPDFPPPVFLISNPVPVAGTACEFVHNTATPLTFSVLSGMSQTNLP